MSMYIPIIIVVIANTFYQICAKSTPVSSNTFASLSVTYAVGAVASVILFFITQRDTNLISEYRRLNWSSYVLGLCVVGLEAGFLYMYKVGWKISTGQIVSSAILAVVLIIVGYFFYHEQITPTKIAGIVICLAGLYLINR